ncbi:hypothetical protein NPX13_g3365 [Xylaria arbuscula]|uniref:Heterokaryon incompatibility domain-containing protein n=1 Tax=Xylaria arbuscula TaxID=114810 RepID=A0A9W8NID4_9PEZI|nr:hypothetical protein NPX13_g3365 [Xylaria arbuscula]
MSTSQAIMVDDTRGGGFNLTTSQISSSMEDIARHRTTRLPKSWLQNLRFLTVDKEDDVDSDNDQLGPAGKKETGKAKQSCARRELDVAIPTTRHFCYPRRWSSRSNLSEDSELRDTFCAHVAAVTCAHCKNIPLFTNRSRTTRFRIHRAFPKIESPELSKQSDPCRHFVAVSYCWDAQSSDQTGAIEDPYTVVEEDGSVRNIRASKQTIDRAVAFAAQNGYRMIWIDQECIEQDKPDQKEIAIQFMDMVYLYAHITIGLYSARLEQIHLNCLLSCWERQVIRTLGLEKRGPRPAQSRRQLSFDLSIVREAFKRVANDPWNSRAWILQETFASAGNMLILLPYVPGVTTRHLRLYIERLLRPSAAVGQLVDEIIRFKWFHPPIERHRFNYDVPVGGVLPRDVCSAATAISFLRYRDNSVPADRLAIIANMCGYELRLNPAAIQKTQSSLALCVMALAIMNGDFSLLALELYESLPRTQDTNLSLWSHLKTRMENFHNASSTGMVPIGAALGSPAPESYHLSSEGLRLPGLMWKVQRFISLRSIQKKYRSSWLDLDDENHRIFTQYYSGDKDDYLQQIKMHQSMRHHMYRRKHAITQILFDVLMQLKKKKEIEVADAIWQSVWKHALPHSERRFERISSVMHLPSNLRNENRAEMFDIQQIDCRTYSPEWFINRIMRDGRFWVADIVRSSQDTGYPLTGNDKSFPWQATEKMLNDLFDNDQLEIHDQNKRDDSNLGTDGSGNTTTQGPGSVDLGSVVKGKIQGGLDKSMVQQGTETHDQNKGDDSNLGADRSGNTTTQEPGSVNLGSIVKGKIEWGLVGFAMHQLTEKGYPQRPEPTTEMTSLACIHQLTIIACLVKEEGFNQAEQLRGQYAVFDVDGAADAHTMVLTPFSAQLEGIPAPAVRSMGVSWVVERAIADEPDTGYESFRPLRPVPGMWQISLIPGGRYRVV